MEEGVTEAAVNTATSKVVMDNSWPVKIDINQYCRACANPSDCLVEIFETEGIRHELALKVNKYLPIKVCIKLLFFCFIVKEERTVLFISL